MKSWLTLGNSESLAFNKMPVDGTISSLLVSFQICLFFSKLLGADGIVLALAMPPKTENKTLKIRSFVWVGPFPGCEDAMNSFFT